jgi:hypothetical protein
LPNILLEDRGGTMQECTHRSLVDLRKALLQLHKVLLEIERIAYEQVHGRVSAGELLKLLIQHRQFKWLHAVSEIVVRIDELLDGEEEAADEQARLIWSETRSLLIPAEDGAGFAGKYYLALQRDPSAVLAHRALREVLAAGARDA